MLQKRAARVILEADTRSNSVKLFKKLARLRLHDEIKLNKSTLVFKRLQGSCPAYMCDLLKSNADLHRKTGPYSKLNLACPLFNRETEEGSTFSVSATKNCGTNYPLTYRKRRQQLVLSERPFTDFSYRAMMK